MTIPPSHWTIELEAAAYRLSMLSPITPEDALILTLEHGLSTAETVAELLAVGFSRENAVELATGQAAPLAVASAKEQLMNCGQEYLAVRILSAQFHNCLTLTVILLDGIARAIRECGRAAFSATEAMPGIGIVAFSQPNDAISSPCIRCKYHSNNPHLACAVHPLGHPEGECPDWAAVDQ